MNKNRLRYVFIIIFLSIIYIIPVLTLFTEDKKRSVLENRALKEYESINIDNVNSGEYFNDLEKYLIDHVYGRDNFMMGYADINTKLLGKKVINDVVLGKDQMLLPERNKIEANKFNQLDGFTDNIVGAAVDLNKAVESYGGDLFYMNIPEKETIYSDKYPNYFPVNNWYAEKKRILINEKLEKEDIPCIDVKELLESKKEEALYYNTDHHYTYKAAYYVYLEFLKTLNSLDKGYDMTYPKWEEMNIIKSETPFFGSYSKKIVDLKDTRGDYLEYALPKDFPKYIRYEEGKRYNIPLVDVPKDAEITGYHAFLGNNPNTVIKTNREHLPNILIIGYSFTNPLEILSTYNFNEMHSIDPRHYKGNISNYITERKPDVVLIVKDDLYEGNKQNVAKIKEGEK